MAYFVIPVQIENRGAQECDPLCLHTIGKLRGPFHTLIGARIAARKMSRIDTASFDNRRRVVIIRGSLYTPIFVMEIIEKVRKSEIVRKTLQKIKEITPS